MSPTLVLDTVEMLRANWKFLSPEQIQQLLDDEIVDIVVEADTNQRVISRTYTGQAVVRSNYRFLATGEIITPFVDWLPKRTLKPETMYAVAGLIMQLEPDVLADVIVANGGTMPEFKPPIVAVVEPESEPEPTPEPQPQPEEPVEELAEETDPLDEPFDEDPGDGEPSEPSVPEEETIPESEQTPTTGNE
ncbi:hypothetical protein GCM10028806_33930 [Spirosoma terrae]|uniref:Uncharacterized protein n=1 Tax=Spirosoma terrae TaxID=1968276 RepID=A0A6L9L507_9BACT|nr:hypothetical protein [Spirosoma terrae]NDU95705.1 hypothetical protein [Spirosoma terrae]